MLTDSGHAKTLEYDCREPSISAADGLRSKFDGQSRPIAVIPPWRQNAPKPDLAEGHLYVSNALALQRLLNSQTKPDCASLTPFTIEEAEL